MNRPKFKVAHVEEALRASGGVVSDAAQKLAEAYGSCSPASVRNLDTEMVVIARAIIRHRSGTFDRTRTPIATKRRYEG